VNLQIGNGAKLAKFDYDAPVNKALVGKAVRLSLNV
jgi:hypothetical protein